MVQGPASWPASSPASVPASSVVPHTPFVHSPVQQGGRSVPQAPRSSVQLDGPSSGASAGASVPASGGEVHFPPAHDPSQHWSSAVQASPAVTQQAPWEHVPEQQSEVVSQGGTSGWSGPGSRQQVSCTQVSAPSAPVEKQQPPDVMQAPPRPAQHV
jgi:hypothetical protein